MVHRTRTSAASINRIKNPSKLRGGPDKQRSWRVTAAEDTARLRAIIASVGGMEAARKLLRPDLQSDTEQNVELRKENLSKLVGVLAQQHSLSLSDAEGEEK